MRSKLNQHGWWVSVGCALLLLFGAAVCLQSSDADAAGKEAKKDMHAKAFQVFQQKCLGCHVSVADPEKPGRTRDDWYLVVKIMHDYGIEMTNAESDLIIDLLYDLRQGLEREAG